MVPNIIKLNQPKSNINRSSTASGYVSESILPWDGLYAVEKFVVRAVNTNIIRQLKGSLQRPLPFSVVDTRNTTTVTELYYSTILPCRQNRQESNIH